MKDKLTTYVLMYNDSIKWEVTDEKGERHVGHNSLGYYNGDYDVMLSDTVNWVLTLFPNTNFEFRKKQLTITNTHDIITL